MIKNITITKDFIDQRDARAEKYNPNGRTLERLKLDIECEVYEWAMIKENHWKEHPSWKVDGVFKGINIDVKFIKTWYNISPKKMVYLLQQRDTTHEFFFCEWDSRPERLLKAGDKVKVNSLGILPYWNLIDIIKPSKFNGFYADVRKELQNAK
tara:strand:- start:759 stop:1220 length:462 start_codon:yes stop_codon:yes gene_type:complete